MSRSDDESELVQQHKPGRTMATRLPQRAASPSAARAFARETLASWRLTAMTDDVSLIVGELITNAVLHGDGPVTLTLHLLEPIVRIEVSDESSALPKLTEPSQTRLGGRGLAIISAVAQAWGTSLGEPAGKTVWAELNVVK
jgi:anti-sigma regulatory factor (Ser/Thr protein kinase)